MRSHAGAVALLGILGLLVNGAPSAAAARYYVDPQGDDANAGTTVARAFRTIGKAASLVAGPRDTILISPGRYEEHVTVAASGTGENPVTIRRNGAGTVTWTTPAQAAPRWEGKYALWVKEAKHVVVEGIDFKNCEAWILLDRSHWCTVRGCSFDGARIYNCSRINSGSNNRFVDCDFRHAITRTGFRADDDWIPTPGADYIEIFRDSHANLVESCRFADINHVAVSISAVDPAQFTPSRNIVRNCVFTDPYWKCFWVHAGKHNLLEDNVCTGTSACFLQLESESTIVRYNTFRGFRDSTAGRPDITLRGAVRMQYSFSRHNRIYHNLFVDNDRTLTNNSFRWEVLDNVFKNNIFFNNRQTVFLGFPEYRTKNRNYFVGNLMTGTRPGEKLIRLERDDYTLAEAQEKLPELYRGNIEGDPRLLRDGRGGFAGRAAGSPCIDRGVPLTATREAGSGRQLAVDDALYFFDGAQGMIQGDRVSIGAGGAGAFVTSVDYENNVLLLDREVSWKAGDAVNLQRSSSGKGPDIGPFEREGR